MPTVLYSLGFKEPPPPASGVTSVEIALQSVRPVENEIELGFSVNHTIGVDAFAAVADDSLHLAGATVGPTVTPA